MAYAFFDLEPPAKARDPLTRHGGWLYCVAPSAPQAMFTLTEMLDARGIVHGLDWQVEQVDINYHFDAAAPWRDMNAPAWLQRLINGESPHAGARHYPHSAARKAVHRNVTKQSVPSYDRLEDLL